MPTTSYDSIEPNHMWRNASVENGSQNGHRPKKRTMPDMWAFNAGIY